MYYYLLRGLHYIFGCSLVYINIVLFLLLLDLIMTEKRKRSPNWMTSEKNLLLDIVQKHLSTIENKKTDGATIKQKNAEWIIIRDKYNSQTKYPEHTHRTAENLKAQWESMKKAVKKKSSIQKHLIQTGGSPLKMQMDDPFYNRVLSLIEPSVFGVKKPYDNDITYTGADNQNTVSELTEELEVLESQDIEHFKVLKVESLLSTSTLSPVSVEESNSNHYTPLSVQKPITKNIRVEERYGMPQRNGSYVKKMLSSNPISQGAKSVHDINILIKEEELKIKKEELKQSKIRTRLLLLELRLKKRMLVRDQVH